MPSEPDVPTPDGKDWTWVLDQPCTECGFRADEIRVAELPARIAALASDLSRAATAAGGTERPQANVWSSLEYACHVRDVCTVFTERVYLMLAEDDPQFEDWDQDRTAVEQRYWEQDPHTVADELVVAAAGIADAFVEVRPDQWTRAGHRSNGSAFTIDTIARYFLHDLVHHAHDVAAHDARTRSPRSDVPR